MSLLFGLDRAIEARDEIATLCETIREGSLDPETKDVLIDLCYRISDHLQGIVHSIERCLLPPSATAAITFYPFDSGEAVQESAEQPKKVAEEAGRYSTRTPRRAGDLRGTLIIPSGAPEKEEER